MRLSDLIKKRRLTKFSSVIPLLLPMYMEAHIWNEDDYIDEVYERKNKYIVDKILLLYTKINEIECNPINKKGESVKELDLDKSNVNLVELIRYMVKDKKDNLIIPDELLIAADIEPPKRNLSNSGGKVDPANAAELGFLRLEKIKWDSSIEAATKIGLLFYEHGLEKQSSKEAFMKEFAEQLGNELHDSTIEKIYKALPSGYKLSGGRPKKDTTSVNIDNIIQAAVFVGTLHEAP